MGRPNCGHTYISGQRFVKNSRDQATVDDTVVTAKGSTKVNDGWGLAEERMLELAIAASLARRGHLRDHESLGDISCPWAESNTSHEGRREVTYR